jgi:hypothetical protein
MERDEDLGVRVRIPRVEVDYERSEHERRRRQHQLPGVEVPSAGEVPGKERQHEQAGVPRQPCWFFVREAGSEACNLDRERRSRGEDERLEPADRRMRVLVVTAQDELFPQPAAVLARELPGEVVDIPHPLHCD